MARTRARMLRPALVLMLMLVLPAGACTRDEFARSALADATALGTEITTTIHQAEDNKLGVAAAQALLDSRRAEVGARLVELKSLARYQLSDSVRAQVTPQLVGSMAEVEALRNELARDAAADPEFDAALRKLVADYAAVLSRKPTQER